MNSFKIGHKLISEKSSTFIIAELSANHNQNFNVAVKTVEAAKKVGADAIKLQTYTADTITMKSSKKYFKINQGTIWDGQTLYDLYKKAYTPWEWQPKLKRIAEKIGLICFSSPFDRSAVDFLEKMRVPAYKIASFEITDIPLIKYVASKKKPVIISTGIAELKDIYEAVKTCRKAGNNKIALLKCTSAYPAPPEMINLRTIPDLSKKFNVIPGLSDHTLGIAVPIAAVALGAKIVEKHFILDRKIGGPDSKFSLNQSEFKQMVEAIRTTEETLGTISYKLTDKVKKSREHRRSLFIVKDIAKGEKITVQNVKSIRPGFGLSPKFLEKIMNKKAKKKLIRGEPLSIRDINL